MGVACLSDAARVGNRLWAIREPSPSAESQGVVTFHAASRGGRCRCALCILVSMRGVRTFQLNPWVSSRFAARDGSAGGAAERGEGRVLAGAGLTLGIVARVGADE